MIYRILHSFQKAFKQVSASMGLCFVGLSKFVVEFAISFFAFCCFFYFMLNSELKKFIDLQHTVENTLTMAIGKFNFAALKNAHELAAWIFFAFAGLVFSPLFR